MKVPSKPSSAWFIVALVAASGCDRLPESITGRPDPNAAKIVPAGPSGSNAPRDKMVTIETSPVESELPSSDIPPSPFNNGYPVTTSQSGTFVEKGPAEIQSPFSSPTTNKPLANGLQVPAANPVASSMSDKIRIDTARLKFDLELKVAAQADGLIMKLDAEEGDLLTANSLLIQLDDRLAKSELEVAKKEYEAAFEKSKDDSEIQYSKAAHDVAKEELLIAREIDRRGAGTTTELSKKVLEEIRAKLAITVAQVKNKQDVLAVGVSAAKQNAANVQVEFRKMLAPFDGIVAEKHKERFDWVRAGDVILRLVSMEELKVVGQVRVVDLSFPPHELVGRPADIGITLFPGRVEHVSAKVGYVSPSMDSSGGYGIWLKIPNLKSNDQWVFREGMPATIEISTR